MVSDVYFFTTTANQTIVVEAHVGVAGGGGQQLPKMIISIFKGKRFVKKVLIKYYRFCSNIYILNSFLANRWVLSREGIPQSK